MHKISLFNEYFVDMRTKVILPSLLVTFALAAPSAFLEEKMVAEPLKFEAKASSAKPALHPKKSNRVSKAKTLSEMESEAVPCKIL